jgi:ABC-type polysaccharide/polyol phosphate transport system ATPase subunit
MTSNSPPPVLVDRVQKRFEIPREQVSTLKERALHPFRRSVTDTLHALRGVSFAVEPGEFFGIVGRNGSGKSTLLKCLAGIYSVDSGSIYVNGRMSTFIELGVGFNPDLPARDNVLLNATMLGLSPREARRRFDSVIDFAELGEFVEMKIKNYSSGMLVRLAFSVMIHVDADILLIDEVLAVGDAAFQQKCYDEFERIRESSATVVLVTHDMSAVQRFCARALLLEHGRPVELGDPEHVGNRYLELNFSEQARQVEEAAAAAEDEGWGVSRAADAGESVIGPETVGESVVVPETVGESVIVPETVGDRGSEPTGQRYGDGRAEILDAWFEDEHAERVEALQTGRPCAFAARVLFHDDIDDPLFGVVLQNSRRINVLGATNQWTDEHTGLHRAGDQLIFRISFENVLAPERYHATPAIAHRGTGAAWIDRRERFASVVVTGTITTDAAVLLPFRFAIEHENAIAVAREG